jgi:cell wall-associated NlpC family hydrolase
MLDKEISFDQLKPGDLIFLSATYNSKYARPYSHNIVHVEVYTGKGLQKEGTIAARY